MKGIFKMDSNMAKVKWSIQTIITMKVIGNLIKKKGKLKYYLYYIENAYIYILS